MNGSTHALHDRHLVAAIALIALVVQLPALANGFAYDDVPLIPGDPRVHSFQGLAAIFGRPYWPGAGQDLAIYRPLTTLSFAVDWWISGGAPAWFHLSNVLWHAVASTLAFLLLRSFFDARSAFLGGILFAVHPVHVEAVANVVGRAEPMSATFFFGACVLWVRRSARRPSPGLVCIVAASFLLGLLTKESVATLPLVLVLLDGARGRLRPDGRDESGYWRCVVPTLAALASAGMIFFALRFQALDGLGTPNVHAAAAAADGRWDRLLLALQAWPQYLRLLFFPRTLLADYGPRVISPGWLPAIAGAAILAGAVAGGLLAARKKAMLWALALLWFPITILPVSNLILTIGVLVAERTLYIPSFALALSAAAIHRVIASRARTGWRRRLVALSMTAIVALFTARTLIRIPEWKSTVTIFEALVRDRPDSYRGHWYLGRFARVDGDTAAAAFHFREALRLWPHSERLAVEAAATATEMGRLHDARDIAGRAALRWPGNVAVHRLLAAVSLDLGDTVRARAAMRAGLRIDAGDALLQRMKSILVEPEETDAVRNRP